ncbi:MAG: nucleotide exchange factor GrpE, partial [Betaproteobacteria bacterium]|nr:nucleotide exchange factor GrpE [Betaproteobacteria bacterium]
MPDSTEKKTPDDTIAPPTAESLSPEAAAPASVEASAPEPAISLQAQLEEAQAKVKAWEEEYLRARA